MIFESARIIARRFGPRDLDAFVAMRDDPAVAQYQSWEGCSLAEGRSLLAEFAGRNPGEPGWFQFALEDRSSAALVGDCGLKIQESDRRLAQIGYTIARPHWGQGFATEAVAALARFAFHAFDLHRITASVDPRNAASCRVLEKTGFRKEAHFIKSEWFKGDWADDAVYARLAADR
jgi:RimJ/RimL family protein N-acetyltransferase